MGKLVAPALLSGFAKGFADGYLKMQELNLKRDELAAKQAKLEKDATTTKFLTVPIIVNDTSTGEELERRNIDKVITIGPNGIPKEKLSYKNIPIDSAEFAKNVQDGVWTIASRDFTQASSERRQLRKEKLIDTATAKAFREGTVTLPGLVAMNDALSRGQKNEQQVSRFVGLASSPLSEAWSKAFGDRSYAAFQGSLEGIRAMTQKKFFGANLQGTKDTGAGEGGRLMRMVPKTNIKAASFMGAMDALLDQMAADIKVNAQASIANPKTKKHAERILKAHLTTIERERKRMAELLHVEKIRKLGKTAR